MYPFSTGIRVRADIYLLLFDGYNLFSIAHATGIIHHATTTLSRPRSSSRSASDVCYPGEIGQLCCWSPAGIVASRYIGKYRAPSWLALLTSQSTVLTGHDPTVVDPSAVSQPISICCTTDQSANHPLHHPTSHHNRLYSIPRMGIPVH
jgi:hypothetical protein